MQTLGVDPLREIGKKFNDPLDIVAFELSSVTAKKAVEKYKLYREWEMKKMPNDDYRIIATEIVKIGPIENIKFYFNNVKVITIKYITALFLDQKYQVVVHDSTLIRNIDTIDNNYNLIYYIYNLLESGFKFVYVDRIKHIKIDSKTPGYFFDSMKHSGFKVLEDFKFPIEKYRILAIYISITFKNRSIFRKPYETLPVGMARVYETLPVGMARVKFPNVSRKLEYLTYYLLENGWTVKVHDHEEDVYRIVRNRIENHTIF